MSSLRSGEICPSENVGFTVFFVDFEVDLVREVLDEERVVFFAGRAMLRRVDAGFFVLLVDLDRELELDFATCFFPNRYLNYQNKSPT